MPPSPSLSPFPLSPLPSPPFFPLPPLCCLHVQLQQRHERLLAMMSQAPHSAGVTAPHFTAFGDVRGEDLLQEREAADLSEQVDRMNDVYQQLGGALPHPPAGLEALGSTSSLTSRD